MLAGRGELARGGDWIILRRHPVGDLGEAIVRPVLVAVALLLLLGCQVPVRHADWSRYDGPGAEVLRREPLPPPSFPDPLEPWNRSVSILNHAVMLGVIDPLGSVYRFAVPRPVRSSLQRFSNNLLYPRRALAFLLQGELRRAWDETRRFGVNTTLGGLGFFDPAARLGIPGADVDFGQVFGRWGWRPSTFLVVPLFGPSSVRDAVGLAPDAATNPTFYLPWYVGSPLLFNQQAELVVPYKRFVETTYDAYHLGRLLWTLDREKRVARQRPRPADTAAVQTLQIAFLSVHDPDFPGTLREGSVIGAGGAELPYSYRLQPGAAPIVYLLPGLGSHRLDGGSLALAEMAFDRGFSVAIVSNAMNWEFIARGARMPLPGYTPADVEDVHFVLDAMQRDLEARHPGRLKQRVLMGYSLGAYHALFIAAAERAGSPRVRFDRYVTLDAPVQLLTGMRKLDAFYAAQEAFPPAEREARVQEILWRTLEVAQSERERFGDFSRVSPATEPSGQLRPRGPLPFSDLEARYLVGLDFRLSLVDILSSIEDRNDFGVLQTERSFLRRESAYVEMASYSFEGYVYAFVLPYFRDQLRLVSGMDDLIDQTDLRSVADGLRGNPKIRHFANRNDFLTTPADVAWITETLGSERVTLFPTGGHLGNLHKPEVQAEIMASIADLVGR
jgi:ABC-type transporter lipoprotein component MlaA